MYRSATREEILKKIEEYSYSTWDLAEALVLLQEDFDSLKDKFDDYKEKYN